jgi:hypothetical protein
VICGVFVVMVTAIIIDSMRTWTKILFGGGEVRVTETPFVPSTLSQEEA